MEADGQKGKGKGKPASRPARKPEGNTVSIAIICDIMAILSLIPIATKNLLFPFRSIVSDTLSGLGVEFSDARLQMSKSGFKLLLHGATAKGSGSNRSFKTKTPGGHKGQLYILKDKLCADILEGIYATSFFAKKTFHRSPSISVEDFGNCLKCILKGYFYKLVQINEMTVDVWYPTEKLHSFLKFQGNIDTLKFCCLSEASGYIPRPKDTSIPDLMDVLKRTFRQINIHYKEFAIGQYMVFNMLMRGCPIQGEDTHLSIHELTYKYPVGQCSICCGVFILKKTVMSCCGEHDDYCIRCINGSIQSGLDNVSQVQLSLRCQFGESCVKTMIDFKFEGYCLIAEGLSRILSKETRQKINATGLKLAAINMMSDAEKAIRQQEALEELEYNRQQSALAYLTKRIAIERGIKPEDLELSAKDLERLPFERESVNGNTNNCPGCFIFIERTTGCNAMICSCGTPLCIKCGTYDRVLNRCVCSQSITMSYFEGRLSKGTLFQIRGPESS